jgi:hypothetical protein
MSVDGYTCGCCGQWIEGLPFDIGFARPYHWRDELEGKPGSFLGADLCVIEQRDYFIRGVIEIPVVGSEQCFRWGVWTTLSKENFELQKLHWDTPDRASVLKPMFGWLSNSISIYTQTLNLKTRVHTWSDTQRPRIELGPTEHPLAVEQKNGITLERLREIAESMMRH